MPTNPGPTNLVEWLSLDEVSGTRTGSHAARALADVNTVGSTTGKQGSAAIFVRANAERLTSTDSAFQAGDIDFTIGFWYKPTTLGGGFNHHVISKWVGGTNEYTLGYSDLTSNAFRLDYGSGAAVDTAVGSITAGTWHFCVGWHDSVNNLLGISVDGNASVTSSYSAGATAGASTFTIGGIGSGFTPTDGSVDEAFIYKNRRLTDDEIAFLYNSGAGVTYATVAATGAPLLMQMMRLSHTGGFLS